MRVTYPGPIRPLSPREYAEVQKWARDFDAHAEKIRAELAARAVKD